MSDDTYLKNRIKDLKLNEKTHINILLLGETGVGKSTFINSIANYLTYSDLKKAEKENLLVLIPSKCSLRDKNGIDHVVKIGSEADKNEYLETGVSATQDVKTYVFPIWNSRTNVRLIDTPGMGDTRGVRQDDINCENILSYIGQLHELHAICFLFKPTNTRITQFFSYCMTQIFSRLDKSASNNIIFAFTNTRGTDYSPGDTFTILQQVVKDIESQRPDVQIPLNRNVFCFDNEAFRYLAGVKQDIEFDDSFKQKNNESWKKSVDQCWGLIKYIVGDTRNAPLKPHFIKSTSAINEARRMIVRLSQPLAEITQLINDNLFTLRRHQEFLITNRNSLDDLRKKLYMPVINLKVIKLTQPVTVCTSSNCAEVYKVGEKNKWHYKQRCHDPCHLTNVPKEIIGSPELVHCASMDSMGICQKCNCSFTIHMHVYYMTETVEDRIVDPSIQKNITNKEEVIKNAKKLVDDIDQKKSELETEHDVIVKCCARFAHFLQTNAITPFSDSYREYIEYLIIRERTLGASGDMTVVRHLEKLLREYEEAKKSFNEALQLQKRLGDSNVYITPQKIQDSIQELYKLKHNGKKIKELYECQKTSRSKEHENTEYVHKVVLKPVKADANSDSKKKDKKGGDTQKNQKKPFQKDEEREKHQPRNVRGKSQQRQRPRTPPPPYHDPSRQIPPPPPTHYPTPDPNRYPPPPHHQGSYYPPSPYPPPPTGAYPPPAHGPNPYYSSIQDNRGASQQPKTDESKYELKITVNNPRQNENVPPREPYPYYPGYYDHTHPYPQATYPPPHGGHPPPPGNYPPPQSPYPPPGGYPQQPYDYYNQGPSGQPVGHGGGYQNYGNNGYRRGGRREWGGKGRGGPNMNPKFKRGSHKKRNEGKKDKDDSSEDSDTSTASSKH